MSERIKPAVRGNNWGAAPKRARCRQPAHDYCLSNLVVCHVQAACHQAGHCKKLVTCLQFIAEVIDMPTHGSLAQRLGRGKCLKDCTFNIAWSKTSSRADDDC